MPSPKNIAGQRFGKLLAIRVVGKNKWGNMLWLCKCDCGNETSANQKLLKNGHTKSCGCFNRDSLSKRKTHGLSHKVPEYEVWQAMKQRCHNPKNKQYFNYGGRGIMVCDEWKSFEKFYEDMGSRPSDNHTIEREDNNKGYSKENCIWLISPEQSHNKRNNRNLTYDGKTMTIAEWGRELSTGVIWFHLKKGRKFEDVARILDDRKKHNKKSIGRFSSAV